MKPILGVYSAEHGHWVGDGFPVRTLFSYQTLGRHISPFLMLDYAGPSDFDPSQHIRGVGQHAHRGFETVTIVYQGELEHRDSTGAGGSIGPGDVQWMTAGSGILHEEYHSKAFTREGGTLEMVQLWVNLPRRHKMTAPRYQTISNASIPNITLANGAGSVRLIAGSFEKYVGPASTFTEMDVWDMKLVAGKGTLLPILSGRTVAVVVLRGAVRLSGSSIARSGQWALAGANGSNLLLEADSDSSVLILSGEPIDEPVVGYGPFVMNSEEEIRQAIKDLQSGVFGRISGAT